MKNIIITLSFIAILTTACSKTQSVSILEQKLAALPHGYLVKIEGVNVNAVRVAADATWLNRVILTKGELLPTSKHNFQSANGTLLAVIPKSGEVAYLRVE
jgi:hypothetical protein